MKQKLIILGGGESGTGAALLGQAKGYEVFLSDKGSLANKYKQILQNKQIEFEENRHTEDRILAANLVVKSPGIPDKAPLIQQLYGQGTPVISELEFAARFTSAKLIGITGSNGKTTTTLLTYHLLKQAGLKVGLAGNIGESFAKQVIADEFDYYVLEISSFQLDNMYDTHLNIALLLNITPDHLDRYQYDFQKYVDAKFRILQNMTSADAFVYWQGSDVLLNELAKRPNLPVEQLPVSLEKQASGTYFSEGLIHAETKGQVFEILQTDTPLKGSHNAINMMCAITIAQKIGLTPQQIRVGLQTFQNAHHRLELAGVIKGIRFVNDSKATNVDSVFYALGSFTEPIVLIIGGVDKGNDYTQIEALVRQKVKVLICLGVDNTKLLEFFGGIVPVIEQTQSMAEALNMGLRLANAGDVVLLSPACASFDLFKNYEDRGQQFIDAVKGLMVGE